MMVFGSFASTDILGNVIASLVVSPIRLVFLVAWVFACVYCVQFIEFGSLVPDPWKSVTKIAALFVGPVLIPLILFSGSVRKSAQSNRGLMEVLGEQVQALLKGLAKRGKTVESGPDNRVNLFDAAGRSIDEIYGRGKAQDAHILDFTERIIAEALDQRASDILIDPSDKTSYTIRFRIDGVLRTVHKPKSDICRAVVNSIKAVSGMDISERRRPQDGAFSASRSGQTASFRVASAGVLNGEKVSVRVLNAQAGTFDLKDTGLTRKQHTLVKRTIEKPSGMILMCGPTGSGKTTTLYAMLNAIDRYTRNVITVEDPIEALLPESSQIEINPKADITFAKALRSILRQDPDVICVGEIRDEETAEIALRAAQTGHLVLATIHSNGSTSALVRLLDLGISPLLISSGLSLIVSQRLVRCLCERCRRKAELSQSLAGELRDKGIDCQNVFEPVGCKRCHKTGYLGRTAICDILTVTDQLKSGLLDNSGLIAELRARGDKEDKVNLRKEGLKRVAAGLTSLEEIKRVVG